MSRTSYRSVFVSDVHLGLADCQAVFLLDFLHSMRCERLYLVGDIVDLENMARRPYWHASHGAVVAEVIAIAARGTRVTYIPGKHDAPLRQLAGQRIAGIDFALDATHVAADGRRYHVSHGDEFDAHGSTPTWLLRPMAAMCWPGDFTSSTKSRRRLTRAAFRWLPFLVGSIGAPIRSASTRSTSACPAMDTLGVSWPGARPCLLERARQTAR